MAGKVVTTAAPTREETAAARSYVGSARASGNGLNVKEKAGSDASKVNYYRGSGAAASISASPAQRQQYNQRMDNARLWAQTDEIRGYLNSGQTNRQATNQWLETANTEAQNAKSEDAKNHWANIANALNSQLKSDYWNELETTKTELSKAQEAEATTRKNRDNASIATTSGVKFVDGRDSFTVLKEANQQLAQNVNNAKELSARLEALQAEFEDRFKPDDVRQAEARLTANRGYVTEYGDEMTDVKAADQALVDEWRASMGLNPKYFNTQDKIDAFARDKFFGLASSAMNTAAVGLQWLDQSSDEMVRAQYDAEHGEGAYDKAVAGKNVNVLGDAGRALNKAAINANEESQRDIAKIKQDMSKFGQFGVDLASTALDVGFDAVSGLGLVSMGVRTFGQSALEAQARGADLSGQIKYGLANTAIELATEKISDGLGLVYGKGVSTDITEKAIEKLAKTKAGADLLRFIAGAGGEGVEEVVSDLLSPFANWIIDEQARNDKVYDVDPSELLYDFLLGAAVGAFGQAGEVATGEYAAKNQEISRNRAIENQKAVADYDASFQSRVRELRKYEGMTQAQAEAQATEEMGEAPTLSAGNSAASKIEAIDSLFSQLEQITPDKVAEFRDSLPDEARLTREEFDAAVEMGLLDEVDAPNYLAKGEATSSGAGVESRLDGEVEARKEDEDGNPINRTRRLTERIASAFGRLGYGNTANKGEAYQTATGKTIEQANAEADAASWDAAHANETNVAGGDSASKNLSNYNQAGLNKLWKNHTLTSGQYAEAMVRRGFWSEKMARNFLSTARQNGASAAERKRDLGGFTIGPENAVNAPNSQESSNGTNTLEAPAQEVKPVEESTAGQNQKISINGDQVVAGIVREVNDEIEEDIRNARVRGNKRFDAEGKRQAYIFYGIDGAFMDGQLTADEAFAAMQKYAPDILRDYGYESGADMAAKKKATGEKVDAEIKALAEKFVNREKLSLDQIIAKAWERANSSAKFNHELSGRGKEKAGWNYFISAVKNMHANGEISLEETNAAITKVTGSWGEWALSDIPSMAEQYLAQQQENDTIDAQEGADSNGSGTQKAVQGGEPPATSGFGQGAERKAGSFEPGRTGENGYVDARYVSRAPLFTGDRAQELSAAWQDAAEYAERHGGRILEPSEVAQKASKRMLAAKDAIEESFGIPVTFYTGFSAKTGFVDLTVPDSGIFISCDSEADFAVSLIHELCHVQWRRNGDGVSRRSVVSKALIDAHASKEEAVTLLYALLDVYGPDYIDFPGTSEEWYALSNTDQVEELNRYAAKDEAVNVIYEEICNMLFTKDPIWTSEFETLGNVADKLADLLIENGIFTQAELDIVNRISTDYEADNDASPSNNNQTRKYGNRSVEAPPVEGSGTVKESESAALRQQATRGEENAVRNTGNTSYVSKTNEERSRIADHVIGETEADLTKAVNGLLAKDERWNDQDVVTAERAMYKMVRAIRDYQLGNTRKMPRGAFNALTKRYNDLATRHINEKSAAGQELQATYQFTPEEQIMDRMAKTFLGFTKDGRFAGEAPLAVNAKIYGAAEDAINRITKAREAGDAKALAQVCKDISDVRGIKKMFGPASEFASKMENEILNAIAGQENGVEALNTLALGNLNAICDDVQPYKIVNAAKTIRVMNMLSNMSTIVNNITNNIASGLTSTNALSQGASLLASKAFENITGQTVLTPAAKGWIANKEIRNAEMDALKMATLVQMYGINQENGRLELKGDKGLFNPNANAFEQTMALYKFFIGMGVEATDQVKSEGLTKAMNIGIDKALASGKITEKQAEQMREEARHEVNRLLYKDDNRLSGFVQGVRNRLNKAVHWGNDDIGTIGLGDLTMAFAKIPANVVRARLYATPEGCLLQLGQYLMGVHKAKRMHSEYQARLIAESYAPELQKLRSELADAEELEAREVGKEEREAKISEVKAKLTALNNKMWAEAREKCSGSVYNKLTEKRDNYSASLSFDDAVQRCGYSEATEMSQFEAATYSRKIGKAATSAGMVALGAILRGLGALRDFDQEPDEELRKMYKQKGYTGLMFNWSAIGRKDHEWKDGDIVLSADFLEVVALPLAIGASARECAMNVEGKGKAKAFVLEAGYGGLNKVFESVGDIPGMADAINLYNAVTSQFNTDNRAKGLRVFNAGVEYLANTLPSFFIPNAYTQLGAGLDNTVRDTYTTDNIWQQAVNIALNKTAFLRRKIPASVDMWGEERRYGENKFWGVVNKTLLPGDRIKFRQNKYEEEILRLTKAGFKGATPKISVNGSFEVDGETYTLDADEKREFKENRNKAQAEVYQAVMDSDLYAQLTDEQKVAVLRDMKMDCERNAKQAVLISRGLDTEVARAKWETELETKEQITYLSKMQMAKAAWDSSEREVSDYAAMDTFIQNQYGSMNQTMKDIADNSLTHLDDLYDAWNTAKITSEDWQTAYNIYRQYIATDENGKRVYKANLANEAEMWSKIEAATGANKDQMAWYEENMKLWYQGTPDTDQYYEYLNDAGLSRSEATTTIQTMSGLEALEGYSSVQYGQKYQVIVQTVPKAKQWDAFWSLVPSNASKAKVKKMHALQAQGVSLDTALKNTGMGDYYTKYVDSRGKTHKTKAN